MYHHTEIKDLINFISSKDGIADKAALTKDVQQTFNLTKDRSVFYGESYAVRFCKAASKSFGNTVLSLSALRKYDRLPFIVCLVTPTQNYMLLANTTFLIKISHSSQELRSDNIKGSFNGSDIMREFEGRENVPRNFEFLFTSHEKHSFEENLERLVEATNHIAPRGERFIPTLSQTECIRRSIGRAVSFLASEEYRMLNEDLCARVQAVKSEIKIASRLDNVNVRGRVIECLLTSDDNMKTALSNCLHAGTPLPPVFTADDLGDYERALGRYLTKTDIKTKVLSLSSNPKGYNLDKLLSFLAVEGSVYLIYIVAVDAKGQISTRLCSMYNTQLLSGTRIIKHWAGRNSRGVTQYDGTALKQIVEQFDPNIDICAAERFLDICLS